MRLWEDTVLPVEPSPIRGKPPELPNLPKKVTVDELLQPWDRDDCKESLAKAKTVKRLLRRGPKTYRTVRKIRTSTRTIAAKVKIPGVI
jgi:hypothetical protein